MPNLYSKEFIRFIAHFHGDRDYFECHEVLEEYWKEVDPRNKRSIYVGFIQLAVCQYHHRRNNFGGAKRTIAKAIEIFLDNKAVLATFGFEETQFLQLLTDIQDNILNELPYQSLYLPISDPKLIQESMTYCINHDLPWWQNSLLHELDLIHRHTLRDRTEVIAERERNLKRRKEKEQ